jgi:hypothetical protein
LVNWTFRRSSSRSLDVTVPQSLEEAEEPMAAPRMAGRRMGLVEMERAAIVGRGKEPSLGVLLAFVGRPREGSRLSAFVRPGELQLAGDRRRVGDGIDRVVAGTACSGEDPRARQPVDLVGARDVEA